MKKENLGCSGQKYFIGFSALLVKKQDPQLILI